MWYETSFTRALGVRLPIVGAPMAGGPTTTGLVVAVSEAGGLGVLGAGYLTPEATREAIRQIRRRTSAPFGANLFVTESAAPDDAQVQAGLERLAPYAAELGLTLAAPAQPGEDFGAQLDVICAERVPFFSFTFGIPRPAPWPRCARPGYSPAGRRRPSPRR